MAMHQANAELFQSIKVNDLLEIPEEDPNNSKQLDDNKFGFFKTLKKSISLILQQQQLDDINNLI